MTALHLCLRLPDGVLIVDTCPTREAFETFANGPYVELRRRHGFPDPEHVEDHPIHVAYVDGRAIR
jgi:hypothetical protein